MKDLGNCARAGSPLAMMFALSLISGSALAADATPDVSGVYWANEYNAKIQLVGGGELPLNAEGMAAYERNIAGLEDGSIADIARTRCVPDGLPRALATPYPFEIVQAPPGQVLIVHELNHQIRVIALDVLKPSAEELLPYPWFNGHSVGNLEGDTLVIIRRITSGDLQSFDFSRHAERTVLVRGVNRVRFAYFGQGAREEKAKWHPTWSKQSGLPRLVRLGIEFADGDRGAWPELVVPLMIGPVPR